MGNNWSQSIPYCDSSAHYIVVGNQYLDQATTNGLFQLTSDPTYAGQFQLDANVCLTNDTTASILCANCDGAQYVGGIWNGGSSSAVQEYSLSDGSSVSIGLVQESPAGGPTDSTESSIWEQNGSALVPFWDDSSNEATQGVIYAESSSVDGPFSYSTSVPAGSSAVTFAWVPVTSTSAVPHQRSWARRT